MTSATAPPASRRANSPVSRLWDRELEHYPPTRSRYTSLAIVVLTTVVLYYQLYLSGAVGAQIIAGYGMSFVYFVNISVVGSIFGAAASVAAGLADRYGRANIVTVGLLITGLLCWFGIPAASTKLEFAIVFVAIGFVEGIILVATPALVRDFSPQLGRASAMGFWTLGPVLGSLVVSVVVTNTVDRLGSWQDQYVICGIVGIVVFVIALLGLRELSPGLRDQLMVSERDRVLVEARAKGLDTEAITSHGFRQVFKLDVVASAFAISLFLIIYYVAVGFFPIYFQTTFGFSVSQANSLGNWLWSIDAAALLIIGWLSDKLRVRKPFMIVGAVGSIIFTLLFAAKATQPDTSYTTFVVLLSLLAVFLGVAYAPWMASFTETVERHNPALIASGLAVWGLIIRVVIAVSIFFVPLVVHSVTPLVEKGPQVSALAAKYAPELATAAKLSPATAAGLATTPTDPTLQATAVSELSGQSVTDVVKVITLGAKYKTELATAATLDPKTQTTLLTNPTDQAAQATAVGEIAKGLSIDPTAAIAKLQALGQVPAADLVFLGTSAPPVQAAAANLTALGAVPAADLAYLQANGAEVQQAAADAPTQWKHYFWIGALGQLLFIPLVFVMAGFWDPRKARRKAEEHEAWLTTELAKLSEEEKAGV
jgi:ACS family D-galactonate transporter-like MFS transporter